MEYLRVHGLVVGESLALPLASPGRSPGHHSEHDADVTEHHFGRVVFLLLFRESDDLAVLTDADAVFPDLGELHPSECEEEVVGLLGLGDETSRLGHDFGHLLVVLGAVVLFGPEGQVGERVLFHALVDLHEEGQGLLADVALQAGEPAERVVHGSEDDLAGLEGAVVLPLLREVHVGQLGQEVEPGDRLLGRLLLRRLGCCGHTVLTLQSLALFGYVP